MWRGESCANGCLSGWNFLPGAQETGKQENTKNEQLILFDWYCWTDTVAKTSRKKKVSTHGEGLRRSWTGDIGRNVFFCFPMGFGAFLGQGGKNLEKTKKQQKVSTHERVWGEAGQVTWGVFLFFHGLGPVFASFRIWIACMRVCDRSKLQEWKQISRQDDFKQTVQNMRVSTMCTPSPPMILPSERLSA